MKYSYMKDLSIVLCTYNEANNIRQTINNLLTKDNVKEIIIIDDDSNDGTVDILKNLQNSKIKIVIRKKIRGFASAFIDGLKIATGDYILRFDLDMYESIDFFFDAYQKISTDEDCIIFSRYIDNGMDSRSAYRSIPSYILNKLCQKFLSSKVKDYTSCIMIFKRDILSEIFPKNTHYANFIIDFVFEMIRKNKNIKEVPFVQNKITEANSKSAPNVIKFLFNGSFYLFSILRCMFIKFLN